MAAVTGPVTCSPGVLPAGSSVEEVTSPPGLTSAMRIVPSLLYTSPAGRVKSSTTEGFDPSGTFTAACSRTMSPTVTLAVVTGVVCDGAPPAVPFASPTIDRVEVKAPTDSVSVAARVNVRPRPMTAGME